MGLQPSITNEKSDIRRLSSPSRSKVKHLPKSTSWILKVARGEFLATDLI